MSTEEHGRLLTSLHQDRTQSLSPDGWVLAMRGALAVVPGQVSTIQQAFAGAEPQ